MILYEEKNIWFIVVDYAHVSNKELKKYKWSVDSKVNVDITYGDAYDKSICVHFYVSKFEKQLFGNKVVFSLQ